MGRIKRLQISYGKYGLRPGTHVAEIMVLSGAYSVDGVEIAE
jgi:hypothetical protein